MNRYMNDRWYVLDVLFLSLRLGRGRGGSAGNVDGVDVVLMG